MQSQTRQASIECKYILVHSPTCGIQCKYIEGSHHSIAFNAKMHFGVHIHTSLGGGRFSWKPILRTERRRTMRIYISGNDRREVHGDSHLRQEKGKRLSRRRTMADVGPWPMAVARRPLTQTALGVDIIKQYLGHEQIELKVTVQIPGSWFGGSAQGALTASERRDYYEAHRQSSLRRCESSDAESDKDSEEDQRRKGRRRERGRRERRRREKESVMMERKVRQGRERSGKLAPLNAHLGVYNTCVAQLIQCPSQRNQKAFNAQYIKVHRIVNVFNALYTAISEFSSQYFNAESIVCAVAWPEVCEDCVT